MKKTRIAAVLAAALLLSGAALAVAPETQARRAAVSSAQADYVNARDKARKDYALAKAACNRLDAESRSACLGEAKAQRMQALSKASSAYEIAVANARNKTKGV